MKNPVKKPSWWDEFAAFAIKGNAMALAVGTIIGAVFFLLVLFAALTHGGAVVVSECRGV